MKYFMLLLISVYQSILSPILKNLLGISGSCRFNPTCSNYARESILKYGAMQGGRMVLARVLKCQPFYPAFSGQVK